MWHTVGRFFQNRRLRPERPERAPCLAYPAAAAAAVPAPVRGFTLIELLVSLAIISVALGATVTAYPKMQESMAYRSAIRGVLAAMTTARGEARRTGLPAVFYVDSGARTYGVGERELGQFPKSIDVRFTVAGQEASPKGRGQIRFDPNGGATGGSVDLLRGKNGGVRVKVDWLFGSVSQEPLPGARAGSRG
jgi:general secretion pathway protein H